jgi:hypothetical protein
MPTNNIISITPDINERKKILAYFEADPAYQDLLAEIKESGASGEEDSSAWELLRTEYKTHIANKSFKQTLKSL